MQAVLNVMFKMPQFHVCWWKEDPSLKMGR
jgi:hypothetical protein